MANAPLHPFIAELAGDLKATENGPLLSGQNLRKWAARVKSHPDKATLGPLLVAFTLRMARENAVIARDQGVLLVALALGEQAAADALEKGGMGAREAKDLVAKADVKSHSPQAGLAAPSGGGVGIRRKR